jgi:peptidoglycan/xylan/chitin deacetylase (PgdA/CDA1 family)
LAHKTPSLVLIILLILTCVLAGQAAAASGILLPAPGAVISGVVEVRGLASRPDFAKWQLDLLPEGKVEQASFLALGETPLTNIGSLALLDTTRVADGSYTLRLRVVGQDGNYDEYFTPVTVANQRGVARPAPARSAARLGLSTHTAEGRPILYLTFDDGPHPTATPQVLGVLKRYGARATFFVVGKQVRRWPDALRATAAEGHTIANHTWSHPSLAGLSPAEFAEQLAATENAIQEKAGDLLGTDYRPLYLRPPYGAVDAATDGYAAQSGYLVARWDVDPQDWRRRGAEHIAGFVTSRAFPGAVVVLHDNGNAQTAAALDTILGELSAQGYEFRGMTSN